MNDLTTKYGQVTEQLIAAKQRFADQLLEFGRAEEALTQAKNHFIASGEMERLAGSYSQTKTDIARRAAIEVATKEERLAMNALGERKSKTRAEVECLEIEAKYLEILLGL